MQANHAKGCPSFFDDILAAQEQQPCLFLGATTPVEAPSCLHFHKHLEMGLCLSGRGVFYIHGEVYPYGAGDISLIYPGESHIAQSARSAPSDWLFLTVDTERLFSGVRDEARLRALSFRPLGTGHVLSGEENRTVVAFLRRIISLYEDKSRTHDEKREQYAALLACFLYESVAWEHTGTPEDEELLRRETTVTSVTYVDGSPRVRYVADEAKTESSQNIKPTLEDAYIYALGGVKR